MVQRSGIAAQGKGPRARRSPAWGRRSLEGDVAGGTRSRLALRQRDKRDPVWKELVVADAIAARCAAFANQPDSEALTHEIISLFTSTHSRVARTEGTHRPTELRRRHARV